MRRVISSLILLLLAVPSLAADHTLEGRVIKVIDGDTITILDSKKRQHRIRLAGIDAPEKKQPFGNASRKQLGDLVGGKNVRVDFDKFDHFRRIVGKVWVFPPDCPTCGKTLDVGLMQIKSGMAWWFRRYAHEQSREDRARYEFAEREAKTEKIGLWRDVNPLPPWSFRHSNSNYIRGEATPIIGTCGWQYRSCLVSCISKDNFLINDKRINHS